MVYRGETLHKYQANAASHFLVPGTALWEHPSAFPSSRDNGRKRRKNGTAGWRQTPKQLVFLVPMGSSCANLGKSRKERLRLVKSYLNKSHTRSLPFPCTQEHKCAVSGFLGSREKRTSKGWVYASATCTTPMRGHHYCQNVHPTQRGSYVFTPQIKTAKSAHKISIPSTICKITARAVENVSFSHRVHVPAPSKS